jgi:LexA DNA binding domain.
MIDFSTEQGRQPSVREIGMATGLLSTSTTAGYLRRMVNEGLLAKGGQARRNYYVTRSAAEQLRSAG